MYISELPSGVSEALFLVGSGEPETFAGISAKLERIHQDPDEQPKRRDQDKVEKRQEQPRLEVPDEMGDDLPAPPGPQELALPNAEEIEPAHSLAKAKEKFLSNELEEIQCWERSG